jgi:hypothetical protein
MAIHFSFGGIGGAHGPFLPNWLDSLESSLILDE